MEISDLIKSARIEKGLTQQQLADVVFVTRQTISKWELGKSVPDQASLILLYQYLDSVGDNDCNPFVGYLAGDIRFCQHTATTEARFGSLDIVG